MMILREILMGNKQKLITMQRIERCFCSITEHSDFSFVLPALDETAAFSHFSVQDILSFLRNFGCMEREKWQIGCLNEVHFWNRHNEVNSSVCLHFFTPFFNGLGLLGSFFLFLQKDFIVSLALGFLSVLFFQEDWLNNGNNLFLSLFVVALNFHIFFRVLQNFQTLMQFFLRNGLLFIGKRVWASFYSVLLIVLLIIIEADLQGILQMAQNILVGDKVLIENILVEELIHLVAIVEAVVGKSGKIAHFSNCIFR